MLFISKIPDQKSRESNQRTKSSIAYANISPVERHGVNDVPNVRLFNCVYIRNVYLENLLG